MAGAATRTAVIPERGKHDKEGRRLALIEAAVEVFAEQGFDAATTRKVAARAGCSEGLIHRYFGGKRGLLLAAIEEKHAALAAGLTELVGAAGTIEEKILELVSRPLEVMWEARAFMRVAIARSIVDPEMGRNIGKLVTGLRVAFMAERLAAHQLAGKIRPEVDVRALAELISGVSFSLGFMEQVVFGEGRATFDRLARESARIICRGILPPGEAALQVEGGTE